MINYTNDISQTLGSFEEVRNLIEKHNAWGMEYHTFISKAARKVEGHTTTNITYQFNRSGMGFADVYALLQYIHKFYGSQKTS
jgi:hypothetical protein